MKTEYQKCMDGEFFTADEEMLQIVYRCKRLVRSLNSTDMENTDERRTHGDIIDLKRQDYRGFDVVETYVQIVAKLKEKGF